MDRPEELDKQNLEVAEHQLLLQLCAEPLGARPQYQGKVHKLLELASTRHSHLLLDTAAKNRFPINKCFTTPKFQHS